MGIYIAAKYLRYLKRSCNHFVSWRFLLLTLTFSVIILLLFYASLPLHKPVFFSKHTVTDSVTNRRRYIYKYPGTPRRFKLNYTILLWTKCFDRSDWSLGNITKAFTDCPMSNCVITTSKSDVYSSDALLFHTSDMPKQNWSLTNILTPYYSLPKYRANDQLWIMVNQEAPPNQYTHYTQLAGVFNWTATYRKKSEIHIPYGLVEKRRHQDLNRHQSSAGRAGVVWVVSNCQDPGRRQLLVHELQKYMHIDIYGSCGKEVLRNSFDFNKVLSTYKFYLSFENSNCEDYITEKLFERLKDDILPVVLGGGNYKEQAPPHSHIDISDFKSGKEVAEYLHYLDNNETAYNEYFDWKKDYMISNPSKWCAICEALYQRRIPHQVYTDLDGWTNDDICHQLSWSENWSKSIDGWAASVGII